jgi:hypothetical protein
MEITEEIQKREKSLRRGITQTAVIWTPIFAATAGAWVFFLWDRIQGPDYGSTWFLMVVLSIFLLVFGVQSTSALRDLFGQPREASGMVSRFWTKRDSFVFKSYYIRVDRKILRGDRFVVGDVRAGDHVELRYFPHSGILIAVNVLEPPEQPGEEPKPKPREIAPPKPARSRGRAARPEF